MVGPILNSFHHQCHWVRDCPERESYEEEGTNLFSNESQREYLPIFVKETLNCAVLDCGCVRSVCGKKWLESYVKSLALDKSIQEVPSHTRFRAVLYMNQRSELNFQLPLVQEKYFLRQT